MKYQITKETKGVTADHTDIKWKVSEYKEQQQNNKWGSSGEVNKFLANSKLPKQPYEEI